MMFRLHCEQEQFSNLLSHSESTNIAFYSKHAMFKIRPGQKIEMPLSMFLEAFDQMYRTMVYEATQHTRIDARLAIHTTITSLLKFVDDIRTSIMPGYMMVWEAEE